MSSLAEKSTGRPEAVRADVSERTGAAGGGRLLAAGGAAFAVLAVVGNLVYTDGGRPAVGFGIELVGYVALAVFVAWAAGGMAGAPRWAPALTLFGGAAMLSIKLGGWASLWASKQVASAEVAAALVQVDEAAWTLSWMPYGLLLAALSYAALRSAMLPAPVAWVGVAVGASCIAAVPFSTGEPFVFPWLLSLVWLIVASSILALRRGPRQSETWSVEV
jgi:hypothetical protein